MPELHQGGIVVTLRPHCPTLQTRETVEKCVAFGMSQEAICAIINCTPLELKGHYALELQFGLEKVNAQVGMALMHAALEDRDINAMKFWLTNRAGWLREGEKKSEEESGSITMVTEKRTIIERILKTRVVDTSVVETVPAKKTNGSVNGSNGMKHK